MCCGGAGGWGCVTAGIFTSINIIIKTLDSTFNSISVPKQHNL